MEHGLHVAGERYVPAAGIDLGADEGVHPFDVRPLGGVETGKSGRRPNHVFPLAAVIMASPGREATSKYMQALLRSPTYSMHRGTSFTRRDRVRPPAPAGTGRGRRVRR